MTQLTGACTQCGAPVTGSDVFCVNCGHRVSLQRTDTQLSPAPESQSRPASADAREKHSDSQGTRQPAIETTSGDAFSNSAADGAQLGPIGLNLVRHPYEASRLILATVGIAIICIILVILLFALATIDFVTFLSVVIAAAFLIPGIWWFLQLWKSRLLGGAVKVSPVSFPEIYRTTESICEQLDYRRKINVFVSDTVEGKAQIINFMGERFIVIEGGFAAELENGEEHDSRLHFMIGSFIGGFKARHSRFGLIVIMLEFFDALKFVAPVLLPYYRATTYTGDQIGYMCADGLKYSLPVVSRFLVGKEMGEHIAIPAILEQALLVQRRLLPRYSQLLSSSPHLVNRYVNLIAFAARAHPSDFENFVRGLDPGAQQNLFALLRRSPNAKLAPLTLSR